jgi:hypothetical protein
MYFVIKLQHQYTFHEYFVVEEHNPELRVSSEIKESNWESELVFLLKYLLSSALDYIDTFFRN